MDRVAEMRRSRFQEFVERILPWFDRDAEMERDAETERIRKRAIAARIDLERIQRDYVRAAQAARRR